MSLLIAQFPSGRICPVQGIWQPPAMFSSWGHLPFSATRLGSVDTWSRGSMFISLHKELKVTQLEVDLKCVLDSRTLFLNHCPILHCPPSWSQEFGTGKPGLTQSVQKLKTWKVTMMKVGWAAEVLSSYADAKRKTAQMHSEKRRSYEKCGQSVEKLRLFRPHWRETLTESLHLYSVQSFYLGHGSWRMF